MINYNAFAQIGQIHTLAVDFAMQPFFRTFKKKNRQPTKVKAKRFQKQKRKKEKKDTDDE
jgi:hypothetical protein